MILKAEIDLERIEIVDDRGIESLKIIPVS